MTDEELKKLKNDCKRSSPKVGLLVAYKTKVDAYIEAGYHPRSWIEYYQAQDWILQPD